MCEHLHTLMVASSDPETRRGAPFRRIWQEFTTSECSPIFLICTPCAMSHALTVLSGEADTIRSQSDDQCSSRIAFLWPCMAAKFSQSVSKLRHSRMSLSWPADAKMSPSGLYLQVKSSPLCPSSRMIGAWSVEVRLTPWKHHSFYTLICGKHTTYSPS